MSRGGYRLVRTVRHLESLETNSEKKSFNSSELLTEPSGSGSVSHTITAYPRCRSILSTPKWDVIVLQGYPPAIIRWQPRGEREREALKELSVLSKTKKDQHWGLSLDQLIWSPGPLHQHN